MIQTQSSFLGTQINLGFRPMDPNDSWNGSRNLSANGHAGVITDLFESGLV